VFDCDAMRGAGMDREVKEMKIDGAEALIRRVRRLEPQ
jgi:hypothetical protein